MSIVPLTGERLRRAVDALAGLDPDVAAALRRIGYPPARQRDPGFATLVRIIVAQQVSTMAAAAIWRRLELALDGEVTAARLLMLDEAALRAAGLGARKAAYARGLAEAVASGRLDMDAIPHLDDEAAVARLTALDGFGRWSAEIYLLFALGRADAFPAGDLAVQIAFQRLKRLPARPTDRELRRLTLPWSPWRGAGAVFLWHYYGAVTLDGTE
ncbi:DNA-3-methyladenine glycosylase family protein [Benzoatithermus flavus]|uniref:DNA-3-methyladenine glycosylase II n=1 Tax=Benzoatithermus flavus TaxID=3108223 RepID=A0ABU8XPH3_9PROT